MERKMKVEIIILAMIFGVNSCSTSNVALGVLGGLAVVTAMNSKGSSNYKGTKRVCTAYSAMAELDNVLTGQMNQFMNK